MMKPPTVPIERLRTAYQKWRHVPLPQRLSLVRRLRGALVTAAASLASASAGARGRPVGESLMGEVLPLIEACRFLEREAPAILRTRRFGAWRRPLWLGGVRSEITREPVGVVLIIGPGNYPLFLPGVSVIQALVAGNAVLVKPGTGGGAAAAALADCLRQAGFDADLIEVLPESIAAATAAIEARPDKVIFTGSHPAATSILTRLATLMIPAVIEASGCDAVVVREDADLDLTAGALAFALTFNGGATCIAPQRIFVHRTVADELVRRLAGINGRGAAFPEAGQPAIAAALAAGARRLTEAPVLLQDVPADSPLWKTAVFGPFALIATYAEDSEVIARVNDCPFGLGASIFTRDAAAATRVAAALEVGLVTINDVIIPSADARLPFGGRRYSGFGVTRGAAGLLELTAPKSVTRSSSRFRPAYRPVSPRGLPWILRYLRFTHGHPKQ